MVDVQCPCGRKFDLAWREVRRGHVQCPDCGGWVDVDEHRIGTPKPERVKCPSCETLAGSDSAVMMGKDGRHLVLCAGCGGWFVP